MNHILVILSREQDGRDATPSVGIIDSQSVKTAENGGPRGYDAGRKIRGRKRHVTTDTLVHVVAAVVRPVDIQDRDGGYAGEQLRGALAELGRWTIEIVKRSDRAEGFVLLSCPDAGSWSAALHGPDAAAALRRMSRQHFRHPASG